MKIRPGFTRRQLLQTTSSALLLHPLLRVLRISEAYGQSAITPRAIFVYYPAGSYTSSFWPTGTTGPLGPLPTVTAPLEVHKSDIIMFKGMCTRGDTNHDGAPAQVFAGWGNDSLKAPGPAPSQDNPKAAYTDLFGSFTLSSGGSGAQALADNDVLTGRKRIIDYLKDDVKRIAKVLGPLEGDIFEAHVLSLDDLGREIDQEISARGGSAGGSGGAGTGSGSGTGTNSGGNTAPGRSDVCSPKGIEARFPADSTGAVPWYHLTQNAPTVFKLQRSLMVQAMACGLTRVGMLQYGNSDVQSDLLAEGAMNGGALYHLQSHAGGATYYSMQAAMMREVSNMMTDLKAAKIGDHSLFDETLIFIASDIGDDPNGHDGVNIPAILAGRLGGKIKGGRMIEYPYTPRDWSNLNNGKHWNHLLVSIAHLMGVTDVDTIGNSNYKGPLKELLG
ncbi:MAG: DUF1552 domain-containing protein [Proteobacteria bacterium]|nr:MAG: DUF1552 domain-containing protein [Pseudomonadota bacterium]